MPRPSIFRWPLTAFLFATALAAPIARGQTTYTLIASTATPVPGGGGTTFDGFNGFLEVTGGQVYFNGASNSFSTVGLFSGSGGSLTTHVDQSYAIPGGPGNFTSFEFIAAGSSPLAFVGVGAGFTRGLYSVSGGNVTRITDSNTAIPGGGGSTFDNYGSLAQTPAGLLFSGGLTSTGGIYLANGGTVTRIADTTTAFPGGGTFLSLSAPVLSGATVAFTGSSSTNSGVFTISSGVVTRIADFTTAIPGGVGNFNNFGVPQMAGSEVLFIGSQGLASGIYVTNGGSVLSALVDGNTPIPGGTGNFTGFGDFRVSGTTVVFTGYDAGFATAYYAIDLNGTGLRRIIGDGDVLDGQTIQTVSGYVAFEGSTLAFGANFAAGTAVYTANIAPVVVPEPATWAAAALLLGLVASKCGVGIPARLGQRRRR